MKNIVFILLSLLVVGCTSTLTLDVKPELVRKFRHDPKPTESETHVYVIRGPAWAGSAHGLEVGVGDRLVSYLRSGTYDLIRMGSGFNTLYLSQFGETFHFKRIDNRKGETLFFYFNPITLEFNEVRPALGKSLVMQTKLTPKVPSRDQAEYYPNALMNPSVAGMKLKSQTKVLEKKASKDFALLNIARPSTVLKEFELAIWSDGKLLEVVGGEDVSQILLPEGKHTLYTYINGFSPLEIEVEKGKTYYAKVEIEERPFKLISRWTAFNGEDLHRFYDIEFSGLSSVEIDPEQLNNSANRYRIEQAETYFKLNAEKPRYPKVVISADMGI
ncbi:hypothetical protein [Thalassomonas actiniarum]|uniref:Uncharacterized protein n=1 Tax=Thalassomonas actiniarum TaxID=485447 RepID=A0AAE9YPW9_9GAMM|nr:hypothetical protein [Thalassomonas actiniarum]WDD98058.1 hypothetical protein SG35_022670 [Thalassomonas actiniarum]